MLRLLSGVPPPRLSPSTMLRSATTKVRRAPSNSPTSLSGSPRDSSPSSADPLDAERRLVSCFAFSVDVLTVLLTLYSVAVLLALLGELEVHTGSVNLPATVSYASQHPWLESSSIRDSMYVVLSSGLSLRVRYR